MPKKINVKKIQEIIELSKDRTLSRNRIAKQVGVSKKTVWKYQHEYGLI